jgi:nicotinamide-nucleotide amidase
MNNFFDSASFESIGEILLSNQETISVAESVTAGMLQTALSGIPDASGFFNGGITTYNLSQKVEHLKVDANHALSCNCVSERVATEMAINACSLFASDWGISITGYATPVEESGNKLYAYYSIVHQAAVIRTGHLQPDVQEPFEVQRWYTNRLLTLSAEVIRTVLQPSQA